MTRTPALGVGIVAATFAGMLALLVLLLSDGCSHTPGAPPVTGPRIVQCGVKAVQDCAPGALGAVNECLLGLNFGTNDVDSCLMGLIKPAGCVTLDVIGCLVRHEGGAARDEAAINPADKTAALRYQRAKEWLQKRQITFID